MILGDASAFSVADMRPMQAHADLSDVELLTLSACNSVVAEKASSDKEFEGLGAVFQQMGARAVLGSLWAVSDGSTAELMRQFYSAHGATRQMSKARALQQAQLALLEKKQPGGADWSHP